jgi:carbonic anhydrase/acetyltransferase-like protein (isoleucine patch superfamily)
VDLHLDDFSNQSPDLHPSVFVAGGAQVVGDVRVGKDASIWYNCVLRGDIQPVFVGERTNIQDGSILHVDLDKPCRVGNDVVVGHRVNLHGCTVEDGCLIGIGAVVLSGVCVGKGSVVAAGAVVLENTVIPPGELWAGVPARCMRKEGSYYERNLRHAADYVRLAAAHRERCG